MTLIPTAQSLADAIDRPLDQWHNNCHSVSLAIVKSGALGTFSRVARGTCRGVGGQHSWIVIGQDVYRPDAQILDPTLWTYDDNVQGLWSGTNANGRHYPHGHGSIWNYGCPVNTGGPVIKLTPRRPPSRDAQQFLDLIGPLDRVGWWALANAPVGGDDWCAAEIIAAIDDTEAITALVPIDVLGMLTDRNPGGLYLAATERSPQPRSRRKGPPMASQTSKRNHLVDHRWLNADLREDYGDAVANEETQLPFEQWVLTESVLAKK